MPPGSQCGRAKWHLITRKKIFFAKNQYKFRTINLNFLHFHCIEALNFNSNGASSFNATILGNLCPKIFAYILTYTELWHSYNVPNRHLKHSVNYAWIYDDKNLVYFTFSTLRMSSSMWVKLNKGIYSGAFVPRKLTLPGNLQEKRGRYNKNKQKFLLCPSATGPTGAAPAPAAWPSPANWCCCCCCCCIFCCWIRSWSSWACKFGKSEKHFKNEEEEKSKDFYFRPMAFTIWKLFRFIGSKVTAFKSWPKRPVFAVFDRLKSV